MSVKVTALCWKVSLPSTQKLVLVRLADYARHNGGSIYPAVGTVAEECGLSSRAVQIALKALIDADILELVEASVGGRGKTSRYALNLRRLAELAGEDVPDQDGPSPGYTNGFDYDANPEPDAGFSAPETPNVVRGKEQNPESRSRNPESDSPDPLESVSKGEGSESRARAREIAERVGQIAGMKNREIGVGRVEVWLAAGYDPDLDIIPAVEEIVAKAREPIHVFRYFDKAIFRRHADRTTPLPEKVASNVHPLRPAAAQQHRGHPGRPTGGVAALRLLTDRVEESDRNPDDPWVWPG